MHLQPSLNSVGEKSVPGRSLETQHRGELAESPPHAPSIARVLFVRVSDSWSPTCTPLAPLLALPLPGQHDTRAARACCRGRGHRLPASALFPRRHSCLFGWRGSRVAQHPNANPTSAPANWPARGHRPPCLAPGCALPSGCPPRREPRTAVADFAAAVGLPAVIGRPAVVASGANYPASRAVARTDECTCPGAKTGLSPARLDIRVLA